VSEPTEREDTEAGTYVDLEREVDEHFDGSWERFLKAVRNPSEILYFVLWRHCDGQAPKIEAWAKDKKLPADWIPRFFGMLTHDGNFRPDAVTRAPAPPPAEAAPPAQAPQGEPPTKPE
jgi:hypothetical protein